jgi:hypothetical protein
MMPMAFQSLSIQAGRWKVPKTLMLIIGDDSCLSNHGYRDLGQL